MGTQEDHNATGDTDWRTRRPDPALGGLDERAWAARVVAADPCAAPIDRACAAERARELSLAVYVLRGLEINPSRPGGERRGRN